MQLEGTGLSFINVNTRVDTEELIEKRVNFLVTQPQIMQNGYVCFFYPAPSIGNTKFIPSHLKSVTCVNGMQY